MSRRIARRWSFREVLAAALTILVALGGTADAQARSEVVFDVRIEKGRVASDARVIRVRQGDVVRLRWSSDRPVTLHLHGYDVETTVAPGAVAEMTFTAHATGRFSIEEHKPDARGGHSHAGSPLVRVEVHPR